MLSSRIDRYLAREVLAPTLLTLLVFIMVMLSGRMVKLADLVINKGVSFGDILALLATLLPPFLAICLPLAFLMGTLLGFGRLSGDAETVALKAGGIGLVRMGRPLLAIALGCTVLTALITFWGAPWGKRQFRQVLFELTRKQAGVALQSQVFIKQFPNLVVYAERLDERSAVMHDVLIVDRHATPPLLIVAATAEVASDPVAQTVMLRLNDGALHREGGGRRGDGYQVIRFASYDVNPGSTAVAAGAAASRPMRHNELTMSELWAAADGAGRPAREARGELHNRLCAPLAPLLFALFALPFSTFSQRSGRGGGFIIGVLIYLAYYLQLTLAGTFTTEAGIHPLFTYWLGHLLLFAAGAYLLRRGNLERPSLLVIWSERVIVWSGRLLSRHAHT